MDGLEAHYALLREVSARGHTLQTRLRTSLPLLWTENVLVMNGAARRGHNEAKSRSRRLIASSALARKDTDVAGADDVERLLGEWSSASRRRRMEWEVSRRIARVDRELQMKPRGRRYWHKAPEVPAAKPKNAMHALESLARVKRVSSAVQTDATLLRSRRQPRVKPTSAENVATGSGHYMLPTASWKATTLASNSTDLPLAKRDAVKPKQHRIVDDELDDLGDLAGEAQTAAKQPASLPPRLDSTASQSIGQQAESRSGDQRGDSPALPLSMPLAGDRANETNSATKRLSVEESLEPAPDPDISADKGESVLGGELSSPRRTEETKEGRAIGATNAHPSSIGRQVRSDYRTMPSVASFEPGPAVSGRGRGRADANLNADVLRRLFNDLDSDRDGHINRIETCLALHRLQIAVPAAKIASFFRNVYSSSGSGKSSYRPLHEVINYKQFVAFVTAAFDKQKQAAEAEAAAKRTTVERLDQTKRKDTVAADSQRLFPSTTVPMLQKRSGVRASAQMKAEPYPVSVPQRETLRYQVEDVEPTVADSIELTNRIVSEMPDFLVGRVLADAAREAQEAAALGKSDAKVLVRKSLEGLPRATEDGKVRMLAFPVQAWARYN